jgi:hypothetical protein
VEVNDPNFIRIKYLRYADDWLVGVCGPRTLAEQIKEELKIFLKESLKLTLSEEKTGITHARKEQAQFLGVQLCIGREGIQKVATLNKGTGKPIKRRSTGSETVMLAPNVKAGGITSRWRIGLPGKTNSKEQKLMNADVQTPTELRRERRSQRRWTYRRSANAGGWRAGRSQHRF